MRPDELHLVLDQLAGPQPDYHFARAAVRTRVRRRRFAASAAIGALTVVLVMSVTLMARETQDESTVAARPPAASTAIRSERYGYSVVIPEGWEYEADVGESVDLPILFRAQSEAAMLPDALDCATRSLGPEAYVTIQETPYHQPLEMGHRPRFANARARQSFTLERPRHFGPRYGDDLDACLDSTAQNVMFNDRGRSFSATVIHRSDSPQALVDRAYEVLDSFRVNRRSLSAFCTEAQRIGASDSGSAKTAEQVSREIARLHKATPPRSVERALDVAEPVFRNPLRYGTAKLQRPLTREQLGAVKAVDEALRSCGLGTEIFSFVARQ